MVQLIIFISLNDRIEDEMQKKETNTSMVH